MAAVAVVISSLPRAAIARDVLATILTQSKLDDRARAQITSEVTQRAKELLEAGSDTARRKDARDTLVGTSRVKNATKIGLGAYAAACAEQLGGLVTNAKLEPALDAILVLVALDHVNTTNALATAQSQERSDSRATSAPPKALIGWHRRATARDLAASC